MRAYFSSFKLPAQRGQFFILALGIFLASSPVSAKSKPSGPAAILPLTGELQNQNGQATIYLEEGRIAIWPSVGPIQIQDNRAQKSFSIDWSQKVEKTAALESVVPNVEEVSLGKNDVAKSYLRGKKDPQGKKLDPNAIAQKEAASLAEKKTSLNDSGVTRTVSEAQDGSKTMTFDWPEAHEEIRLDRRGTFIKIIQEKNQGGLKSRFEQWADGSYTRLYQNASGEFRDIFDANDSSYRLVFYNPKNELLAELRCQGTCESQ